MSEFTLEELAASVQELRARVQELSDREEISELKARYFRLVDAHDWEGFRALFTDDARFDFGNGIWEEGADRFLEIVREAMDGQAGKALSVHRGHMPEITIHSPTEAYGLWGLADYLEWPSDPETGERCGYRGHGHEEETYRKEDGIWKIATWRLTYIRVDSLPRQPLPKTIIGGPPALQDPEYLEKATSG